MTEQKEIKEVVGLYQEPQRQMLKGYREGQISLYL